MSCARRYLIELFSCLGAYGLALAASIALLARGPWSEPAASMIALLPMLPAAAICWVVLRQLRRMDELQRRIQLEALGLAFAGTAVVTFGYGFLELVGYPRLPMFAVWPLMGAFWMAGVLIGGRRYR